MDTPTLVQSDVLTATWPWALLNDVMVKGGISMDTPTLVQSDVFSHTRPVTKILERGQKWNGVPIFPCKIWHGQENMA